MDFISVKEENLSDSKQFSENYKKPKNLSKSKLSHSLKSGKVRKLRNGGMIYIGRIPHGFYEDEMRSYFNQFGKVKATAVARSKKTGRSRGFGFVLFEDEDVAKIAAESMNNYLMFNRIIKCRYIPPEERKFGIFESSVTPNSYPRQQNRQISIKNKNKSVQKMTQSDYQKIIEEKLNKFQNFFEENGINFTFKINENSQDNSENNENDTKVSEKDDEKSESEFETELETDSANGVLEIDESDNDIVFKTPPKVKKVIKKSLNSSAIHEKTSSSPGKEKKTKTESKIQEKSQKKMKETFQKENSKLRKNLASKLLAGKRSKKSMSNKNTSVKKLQQTKVNLKSKKNKNIKGNKKGN